MPSRRFHVKSRLGCAQCKARKVKCDNQLPVCGKCTQRNLPCSLSANFSPSTSAGPPLLQACLQNAPQQASIDLNLLDLELMHHYTTVVCFTFSNSPDIQQTWQVDVPKEAVSHPFLMHSLLAISALHLFHINPDLQIRYEDIAMRYHDLALASFRPLLDNITPENCSALFVVSTFVAIFAFALPQPSGPNTVSAFVNQILKISVFVKGISTVVQTAKAWIAQGKLGRLLRPEVWNSLEALPQEVNEALEHLELRNKASLDSGSDKAIYSSAIQSLKRAFQVTALCSNDPGLTLLWLVAVDHSYMELLRRREQMALVILAHFGVVLHNSRDCWWSEIKPDRLVTAVYCMLNTELRPSLSWTMKSLEISEMTLFDNDDTFSVDVSPAKQ